MKIYAEVFVVRIEGEDDNWHCISTHDTLLEALEYINHLEKILHIYNMGDYIDVTTKSNQKYRIEIAS